MDVTLYAEAMEAYRKWRDTEDGKVVQSDTYNKDMAMEAVWYAAFVAARNK